MQLVDILACHARYTGSSPVGVAIENIKEVFVEKRVIVGCLRADGEMV